MKLFRYESYEVKVSEEALLLKPFKDLWSRDRSKDKMIAKQELAYVYFMADPRSDFQHYIDEDVRSEKIIEAEGMRKGWKPDAKVKAAIEFYNSFKPASALLLEDTRAMIDKLREQLRTIDVNEKDDKGKPIYPISTVTTAAQKIPVIIKALNEAEKEVNSDMASSGGRLRGDKEKTLLEDGF